MICLFVSYSRSCSIHTGYIGTDRSLLAGHNALLLRQIARDPSHALSHRNHMTHEQVSDTQIASKQNGGGANHQPTDFWHARASVQPLPYPISHTVVYETLLHFIIVLLI